jgi:hypothetical protein
MAAQRGPLAAPLGIALGWLILATTPATAAAEAWPVVVRQGRCEVVLPTEHPDEQYTLILGALGRGGPYRVELQTTATDDPVAIEFDRPAADPAWEQRTRAAADSQSRARRQQGDSPGYPPLPSPPKQKTFHLFVRSQDYHNAANYTAVTAELQAVGKHCQVYVDRDHADLDGLRPTIADAVRTFDEEVYPRSVQTQGRALDVDRDGRFTILFSGWLAKLQSGKVTLSGFVRGSDLYRDLPAPFSNHCDMLYLNTDLKPGGYLRTVLAHEFTHAVIFSEHVFGDYLPAAGQASSPSGVRQDEESWLNEGLAHLAEDLHRYSWGNLDYRVSGFLNAPERHSLVVPDYYGTGLWRTPGNRGSVFQFLRWCQEQHGNGDFAARLIRSNLQGVANVEAATQRPFAELFRAWTVALASGDPELHRRLGARLLCGPRSVPVALDGGRRRFEVAGTAAAYCLLHAPGAARARLVVTADPDAQLQVTLIRQPRQTPRLSLRCERVPGTGRVRLALTAHGGAVRLGDAAWEWLAPTGAGDDTEVQAARAWFGADTLAAGATRRSGPLALPGESAAGAVVFKVSAHDTAGRPVAAWAVLEPGQQ